MNKVAFILCVSILFQFGSLMAQSCPCKTISELNSEEKYPPPILKKDLEKKSKQLVRGLEVLIKKVVEAAHNETSWQTVRKKYVKGFLEQTIPGAKIQTCEIRNGIIIKRNPPIPYRVYFENLYKQAKRRKDLKVRFEEITIFDDNTYEISFKLRIVQSYNSQEYSDKTIKHTKVCYCFKKNAWIPKLGSTWIPLDQN